MPSARGILAIGLLVVGVGLMLDAARRGAASADLVLIFPVLSGNSPEFLAGFLAFLLGIILGIFALGTFGAVENLAPGEEGGPTRSTSGGVVLIGPIPMFFGSARPASRWAVLTWVVIGAALTVAVALIALYGVGGF